MQRTRRSSIAIVFALLIATWLAAAPAVGMVPPDLKSSVAAERFLSSYSGRFCPPCRDGNAPGKPGRYTESQNAITPLPNDVKPFDAPSCPLEERLFVDAADGQLDDLSPLEAALVAGGVQDFDDLERYRQKAAALAEELRRSEKLSDAPRGRVQTLFELMHRRILHGGYDLAYTDLRRVLDDGRFNCVSATVLFNYLADAFGVDCRGLEMPGHAMSRVSLSDGTLDIENTCPRWFHLDGQSRQQTVATAKEIGAWSMPTPHQEYAGYRNGAKVREVSPIQLAAMIYYNRGVDLLGEKRFSEAARANAKALRLDPSNATARGNLLATINNWSIELGNRGRFNEAIELLRQGLAMDTHFAAFAQNYVHVHHQWVEHLCREGRFAAAIEVLSRAAAEMPDRDYLRKAQSEVRQRWAKAIITPPVD